MFSRFGMLAAITLLGIVSAGSSAEPFKTAERQGSSSGTVEATVASWCRDRAPVGYEIAPCPPCPGPRYVLQWLKEEWAETICVPVVTPGTEKRTVKVYVPQQVTRNEKVTVTVPVERTEIATKQICVPEYRKVEVPVTRYHNETVRWKEPYAVERTYRWLECEPHPCNPCISVPKIRCEKVVEIHCRERCATKQVPVTQIEQRTVTDWRRQTVTYEQKVTDYERRTEVRPITRTECVEVDREMTVRKDTVTYEQRTVTRCCLRPVWVLVDECGRPILPDVQQGPPKASGPSTTPEKAPSQLLPPPKPLTGKDTGLQVYGSAETTPSETRRREPVTATPAIYSKRRGDE